MARKGLVPLLFIAATMTVLLTRFGHAPVHLDTSRDFLIAR